MPLLSPADSHVQAAEADTQQDIQHGPSETSRQGHDRVAEASDGDVSDQIAEGVADREDGEAEDGVADVEDDAEGFEDADDLVGDGGDPGYADDEAEVAEEVVVLGGG